MSEKSKIQQQLETDIVPRLQALEKSHGEQKTKIQDVINKLSDAIRASNLPAIQNLLGTLEEQKAGPYARLATDTRKLLAEVRQLKPADDGGADAKRILAVTTALGKFEAKLNANFEGIKKMEDMANDVLEKNVADGGDIKAEWQDMEGWLKAQLEAGKLHLQAMEALDELAKEAVNAGDQADLTAAIKRSEERSKWKPTQKEVQERFSKFCLKCDSSGLSKDMKDQLARDRVQFKKIVDELAGINKQMDEIQTRVQNAYISSIDHKALARALKITNPKAVDRLKLALRPEGPARERALRALQNDFKLKFSDKDFATLMKAKAK